MALDLADTDAFLRQLATALRHGFAEKAKITHDGTRVVLIELDLGKDMFVAKRDCGQRRSASTRRWCAASR